MREALVVNLAPREEPVDVVAFCRKDNKITPLSFRWTDEAEYPVKVLEELPGETLKERGAGIRYKVQVTMEEAQRDAFLFRIGDLWYSAVADEGDFIPTVQRRHQGMNFHGKKIIDGRYDNPYKVAVDVTALFRADGIVEPLGFLWETGTEYEIDKVLGQEQAACLRAGIVGTRYHVRVLGKETYLYRDDDLWFMERRRRGSTLVLDVHGRAIE